MTLPFWLAGADPKRTAVRATVLVVLAFITFGVVLLPIRGVGPSMQPAIEQGDVLFVNRLTYRLREPRRGEIVAVRIARGTSAVYVKRLVGMPGEQIAFVDGVLMINGGMIPEPYVIHRARTWELAPAILGPDEYFVVGDNRGMPMELHEMGTTTRARLIGPKAF